MHLKLLAKKTILAHLKTSICIAFFLLSNLPLVAEAYVKFSNKPVESWDNLFSQSGAEKYYTVQRGDTLYDISKTLFGDPEFWPKIWAINSKITNPHIIEKGQIIYFVGGTAYRAPRIGISILNPESYTYGNNFLSPEIPPESIKRGPIKIPKTFPNLLRSVSYETETNEIESISIGSRAAGTAVRRVELTSEVSNSKPVPVGEIKRVFTGARYAVIGNLIYVNILSGAEIGDELSVYRTRPKWLSLRVKPRSKANLVEWLGTVKIKSPAENGYVAEVIHANSIIQTGEKLALRKLKSVELPNVVDRESLKSSISGQTKVIGSHKVAGATVVGEHQVVYLNSGSSAGIEEGGVYPLYTNFGENGVSNLEGFVPKRIGYIKMASVEPSVSTGVVFNLISEVQADQKLGL